MTKVYIVQMRGPEWETIKKVFSDEKSAKKYCAAMNKETVDNDMWASLSTYQYIEMEVV